MATITVDTYLDGGTARTAGEAWACNGGKLLVRTDTRWHANAPAAMAGSLGSVAISSSLGGGYEIDGQSVRWLPFGSGSGTVPAIGATITQGGVSGYFLGVWASLTSAPTSVGAAMPASGFIKFREVTGGPYAAGALSGISASATGPDVVGWIEIVHDQAATITVPRLGKFQTRGEWFDLGVTTGNANQLVPIPTNGSATAYTPGVWIEIFEGADTYVFWPAIFPAGMTTTNLGTDSRSSFVCMEPDGKIRIGHNGTTAVGYVPESGCKIRIPSVIGRQCVTTTRNTNAIPHATLGTRPDFTTTAAGEVDIEHFIADWYLLFAQASTVRLVSVATFETVNVSECASAIQIEDGGVGTSQSLDVNALSLASNFYGGSVNDWSAHRFSSGQSDYAVNVNSCDGITFNKVYAGIITYARTVNGYAFYFSLCSNLSIEYIYELNGQTYFSTCKNVYAIEIDHCDRYVGETNATSGIYVVSISTGSSDIIIDSVTFGFGGMISNCHPYSGVFYSAASSNIKFRNLGSRTSFISGGSANSPAYIFISGGNNSGVKVQRCYMTPTRTGAISTLNSDIGVEYESVFGDFADTIIIASLASTARGCGGTNTTTGQSTVYGTHFWDIFTSESAGKIVLSLNEPSSRTTQYAGIVSLNKPSGFTSAGNISMKAVGDEVIIEMHYFAIGHKTLASVTLTGTNVTYSSGARWGNHDIYYQIDTGSGWNGTWKNLVASNLLAETISSSIGFKLKYRIVCATASTSNLITYIAVVTTSGYAEQALGLYELDIITLSLTGLPTGCDLVVLSAGTSTVLYQKDSVNSTTLTYPYDVSHNVDIGILKPGYIPFYIRNLSLGDADSSIPVSLTVDRNYQ